MSRYYRTSYSSIGYPQWTRAVKILIIATGITFVVQLIVGQSFTGFFALKPAEVLYGGRIWELGTYLFLHDPGTILHILFNMLGLWMFGSELEQVWGSRQFTKFYFICGVGAGVLMVLLYLLFGGNPLVATIGASGAIYGILLAFGMLFPDRIIYWVIFPIRAKYFVMIMGGIAFYSSISASSSGIAHVAHLGGMLCGFVYLKARGMSRGRRTSLLGGIRDSYDRWRRNRLRRKFEVYYNQRHPDNDEKWRRWKN